MQISLLKMILYVCTFIFICTASISCNDPKQNHDNTSVTNSTITDLQVDHLNIWVTNPEKAKAKLMDIGFSAVPDSLSMIHEGQGTSGRYINFLNGYLELIFVYNEGEFNKNCKTNTDLDFEERANFNINGASPISIALRINDYSTEKIPFESIKYHQDWMRDDGSIYAAKRSKKYIKEPSVFVVYPAIEATRFESTTSLLNTPSEDSSWNKLFIHPNGAQNITNIKIKSTEVDKKSKTIKATNDIDNISIEAGNEHLMELYFDDNIQNKSFDLRPDLPLIIHI